MPGILIKRGNLDTEFTRTDRRQRKATRTIAPVNRENNPSTRNEKDETDFPSQHCDFRLWTHNRVTTNSVTCARLT